MFKKELLYFFALKPAYGLKDGDEKSHRLTHFPVAFILRPEALPTPHHVYPFDTGAADRGIFEGADTIIPLDDYELAASHAAIVGHIGWAFGSLQAYFDGELRPDILNGVAPYEGVTRGFIDIARTPASPRNKPDERASAVEVASAHHIRLKDNVLLAVIPRQFLEGEDGGSPNEDVIARLRREGIPYRTYNWEPNVTPNSFREEIQQIVRDFYDGPPPRW